jgi:transcription elongation factor Elf1
MTIDKNKSWCDLIPDISKKFKCGYCGSEISSQLGYQVRNEYNIKSNQIYICHTCNQPSYFDD